MVTTCYRPEPAHLARAGDVAARLGADLVERRAFDAMFAATGADLAYVVGRDHEEVRDAARRSCFVQEGLLQVKLGEGARHPFLRAVSAGEQLESIVDGTLGLANDALHAAVGLGCRVVGVEGSPVLHALLEDGLARFARTYPQAAAIELVLGRTLEVLRAMPDASHDVVFLDPMMSKAKRSAPAFELVRLLAVPDRADAALLAEAARVARRRVVLKLGKGAPLPADSPLPFARHERGAHVVYWIHDV